MKGKWFLLQFIAVSSTLVGVLGLVLGLAAIVRVTLPTEFPRQPFHFHYIFTFVCGIALLWFATCLLSGIYLWRRDRRGYRIAMFLALFQVAYTIFFIPVVLSVQKTSGIKMVDEAIRVFKRVDNGLSLLFSVFLLFMLGVFFRSSDFDNKAVPINVASGRGVTKRLHLTPKSEHLIRGLGAANLFFGYLGLIFSVVDAVVNFLHRNLHGSMEGSWKMSLLGSVIDLVLLVGLSLSGHLLVRLNRQGVTLSNLVLSVETVYWLVATLVPYLSSFRNIGLLPQILTAYPLIALPLLNWATRRLDKG